MDKLFIDLGGHHFLGDDLLKVQDDCQNPLKSFADATGESFIALAGVEISIAGPNISWTAGWIYIAGEICKVDAGMAAYPANNTFQIVQTVDPAGTQIYENTLSVDTYLTRKATILGNAGGAFIYSNLKYFKDWLRTPLVPWVAITNITPSSWVSVGSLSFNAGFRLNGIGELVFRSAVKVASYATGSGDNVVFIIPWGTTVVGCELPQNGPPDDIYLSCEGKVGGVRTTLEFLYNSATGGLEILGRTNGELIEFSLDMIRIPFQ